MLHKIIKFLSCTFVWGFLAVVTFLICIYIECASDPTQGVISAFKRIVLAISYSYVAAAMFHFLVNYCPYKVRQKELSMLFSNKLWRIGESLRQCNESVLNPFEIREKQLSKEDYVDLFSKKDFSEFYPFSKNKSIMDRFSELRSEIENNTNYLLSYSDYLTDEQFRFVNTIISSRFIREELCSEDNKYNNQKAIGQSVFELYELYLKMKSNLQ